MKDEWLDVKLIEKLAALNRQNIPERIVHAKGAGAHGHFRVYMPMSDYTCAEFLQDPEVKTPVFTRFSSAIGSKGSADSLRDTRGFAVRFYTQEGNYDLVGSNLPVFFIKDPNKFPQLIHSLKPAPDTNIIDAERFWNFASRNPETTHMILWLFSDSGTLKSYRSMEGFGVNTYIWSSIKGKRYFVKYHWKPLLEAKCITRQEAEFLAGYDGDVAARDLYDALNNGEKIEYELQVQLIPEEDARQFRVDLLDPTKVWPEDQVPYMRVGKMTLNRSPENYFDEVEQVAFSPGNLVPGIGLSEDKLLQARVFSCTDAQRYRMGPNFEKLSINRPLNALFEPPETYQKPSPAVFSESGGDDFKQAGVRYRSLNKKNQDHIVDNIIESMLFVNDSVQRKMVSYFLKADEELGNRIARGLDFS